MGLGFRKELQGLTFAAMLGLCGCAPSPLLRATNELASFGASLPAEMTKVNLIGVVGYDEKFAGGYNLSARGVLYLSGVIEGTPEYRYRVVRVSLRFLKGLLYVKDGQQSYATGAIVPDHLPQLKAWDIVEVRQSGTYDTLKDFSKTGEGNAIVRVLCRKSDPSYEKCAEALPRIGEYRAQGNTGAPYPLSLKSYGYSYTPAYTETGELLRPLPN